MARHDRSVAWRVAVCAVVLGAGVCAAGGDQRVVLLPKLQAGQAVKYDVHGSVKRHVKTESRVATMLHPGDAQSDIAMPLLFTAKEIHVEKGRPVVVAHAEFDAGEPGSSNKNASAKAHVDFTIEGDGQVTKAEGLDDVAPEMRLAWQFWLSRFAFGWTLPAEGAKPGDKWKAEEAEKSPSPIADLVWEKETTYVGNDKCPLIASETCASFLTRATLKQKSSAKDATPEDYRLHELRTSGTARGTDEIVTYISLKSGLVVRATEETQQSMDVTIAKADGSNGVHYTIEASSRFEALLVTGSDSAVK
ncbi:MAG TPA: hypothetical protein VKA02_12905 [Candidatus Acidoferrum sp.]|nr:hypothetical protein [Candidatus Acidoferrum sp.]